MFLQLSMLQEFWRREAGKFKMTWTLFSGIHYILFIHVDGYISVHKTFPGATFYLYDLFV
jgi:hypothetical protein